MDETGSEYRPEHAGTPRRGFFQRPESTADTRVIEEELGITRALQRTIDARLEHGLRTLEEQATVLMREIASEVWRASGSDARPEQERIVSLLSRDQAIRSLIASSDERFQTLAVRSMRLEDHLGEMAQTTRATKEAMEASTKAIREIADSPSLRGIEAVRSQLEQVERHIAETFSHLDERDRTVTETILRQVQEHGDLIARETTRVVEAMQSYVQGGTEAMGQLAQRVEQHAETFSVQDIRIADDVRASVTEANEPLQARLELISESVGLHGRAQDDIKASVERLIEARMRGLAELIRSDSTALRKLIEDREAAGEAAAVPEIDTEAMAETIGREVAMRLTSAELRLEDRLEKMMDAQLLRIGEQVDARLHDHLEARFNTMAEVVALRAAEAADEAIASSFGQALERMNSNVGAIEGIDTMIAESQAVAEERLMDHIDDRMTGIARLIRSDNQALAARMSAQPAVADAATPVIDPELLRETIRTMKEVQAGLASEMVGSVDARFRAVSDQLHSETQSTAEAMIKVAEVLGQKIDRLSVRVDEGNGNELQVVIDRMTDAIRAMSAARPQRYEQLG
jgi:hypothetical protein